MPPITSGGDSNLEGRRARIRIELKASAADVVSFSSDVGGVGVVIQITPQLRILVAVEAVDGRGSILWRSLDRGVPLLDALTLLTDRPTGRRQKGALRGAEPVREGVSGRCAEAHPEFFSDLYVQWYGLGSARLRTVLERPAD